MISSNQQQEAISKSELALLVLYYLKEQEFSSAYQEFLKECECRKLISNQKIIPIKSLPDLLEEYITLKQSQLERDALFHNFDTKLHPQNAHLANYTLQSIVTLLEVFNQNFKFNHTAKSMALGFPVAPSLSSVSSTSLPPIVSNFQQPVLSSKTSLFPPPSSTTTASSTKDTLPNPTQIATISQKENVISGVTPANGAPLKTVLEVTTNANKTNTHWHITTFDNKSNPASSSNMLPPSSTNDSNKQKLKKDKLKKPSTKPPQVSESRKAQLEKNSKKTEENPAQQDLLAKHAAAAAMNIVDLSTPPSNKKGKQQDQILSPFAQKLISSMIYDGRLIKKLTDTINTTLTQTSGETIVDHATLDSTIVPSEEDVKQASASQLQQQQQQVAKTEEKQVTPTKNVSTSHNTSDPFLSPKQVDTILTHLDEDVDEYLGLLDDNFLLDDLLNSAAPANIATTTTTQSSVNLSPIPFSDMEMGNTSHNTSASSTNSNTSQSSSDSITGVSVMNLFTSPIGSSKRKNGAGVKRVQPESFFSTSRSAKHKRGSGDLEFGSPSLFQGLDIRTTPPSDKISKENLNNSAYLESILDRRDKSEAAIPVALNLSDSFSEDDQSKHSQQSTNSTAPATDAIDDFLNKMNYNS